MTRLMEQAIERLRAVPAAQQDEIARFLLAELEEDIRWSKSTAKHEKKLKGLVDEVLADDARDACESLDPEKL
ncbi:MAG: hypothetical protein ABSB74_16340 [Tepidisphaeraceae bacterium]